MKTDSELKHDVEHELKWEPSVNEAHIGVTVKDGVATLTAHVPAYAEKYTPERVAKRVYGVKAMADEFVEGGIIRGRAVRYSGNQMAFHEVRRRCGQLVLVNKIQVQPPTESGM